MGHRVTTLNVNTIEPAGNTLTIGASGDTVVLADDVKSNTYKDAGGNTLWVSDGSGNVSSVRAGFGDAMKLLATTTVSSAVSSVDFTTGMDSTYKEYIFKFFNIQGDTNQKDFRFQVNASGQSGFNEAMTTTFRHAVVNESGANESVAHQAAVDQVNANAAKQALMYEVSASGTHADGGGSGELHIFNPASTTYVKQFYSRCQNMNGDASPAYAHDDHVAGFINVTAAITQITFDMESGNIDSGVIKMYGVA
jgi:hypothetical protein